MLFTVLEVRLCKSTIYKWEILVGGEFEYCKSMGGTTKRGGEGTEFVKFSGGKQKGAGGTRFLT